MYVVRTVVELHALAADQLVLGLLVFPPMDRQTIDLQLREGLDCRGMNCWASMKYFVSSDLSKRL